jgi:hypothetical protein
MGDLNFRLKRPNPGAVLDDVAAICRKERDGPCGGREDWRRLRYVELLRAAAGEAEKGRYSFSSAAASVLSGEEEEAQQQQQGTAPPSQEEEEEEEEEEWEDDNNEEEEEEEGEGGSQDKKQKKGKKRRRLPALVDGLVRDARGHKAELALQRSLSSYDRQAQREQERAVAATASAGNGKQAPLTKRVVMSLQHVLAGRGREGPEKGGDGAKGGEEEACAAVELGMAGGGASFSLSSSSKLLRLQEPSAQASSSSSLSSSVATATQRGEPVASSWEELLAADELSHLMRSGAAFYNFHEPAIRWPPSYRRVKGPGGHCGDYTDVARLKQAYSIQVKEKGLSFAGRRRLSSAMPGASSGKSLGGGGADGGSARLSLFFPASQAGSSSQQEDSNGVPAGVAPSSSSFSSSSVLLPSANSAPRLVPPTDAPSTASTSAAAGFPNNHGISTTTAGSASSRSGWGRTELRSSVTTGGGPAAPTPSAGISKRVPSYTDRILVHTFPDYAPRVQVGPYELCDALTASDHRPVSTVLRVQVSQCVLGMHHVYRYCFAVVRHRLRTNR